MDIQGKINAMLGMGGFTKPTKPTKTKLPANQQMAKDMGIRLITIKKKLKLADGRIVDGKLKGQRGGDVFEIKVKQGSKYVAPNQLGGNVYPIESVGKTPFIDIDEA